MLAVPDLLVRMTLREHGPQGQAWLDALPALVADVARDWSLRLGAPMPGGYVAFVIEATCEQDGAEAVLKVSIMDGETRGEAEALRHWDGRGAVRLLAADLDRGALLLERLRPGTSLFEHPRPDEAASIACALLLRLWRPAPAAHDLPLATTLAARWAEQLPGAYAANGGPFPRPLLDEAVALCRSLAQEPADLAIVNRDLHRGNVLAAEREPWLLIDPKPMVGERAFDTAHLLRDLLPASLGPGDAPRLVARLADELGLAAERVRAWTFVRTIENALWCVPRGEPFARDVAIAEQLVAR